MKYLWMTLLLVGCDDHIFSGGSGGSHSTDDTSIGDSNTDPELSAGEAVISASCTSSCHAGANMGTLSSRYDDDEVLASVILGESDGPMSGITVASDWTYRDMTNAIAYLRSLESTE